MAGKTSMVDGLGKGDELQAVQEEDNGEDDQNDEDDDDEDKSKDKSGMSKS
jgi:hypothetical protein